MFKILEEVKGAQTIAIGGHIRPDGDCVGSCMAMALFLRKAMPEARVDVFLGSFSPSLEANVIGCDTINHEYETDVESYDVFICQDCEKERLGEGVPIYNKAKKKINIDHHKSNPGCGDVSYIVPTASSACELVYNSFDVDGIGSGIVDRDIAQNVYVGMVTDTGVFKFSNTGRATMEIAGKLLEYGFDFSKIIREVFEEKTYVQQQIMGRALLESIRILDGRAIFSVVDMKTLNFYQAKPSDLDGISSQILLTEGCDCSIFLHELKPLQWKVSLRSNGAVDVSKVCEQYGGGGHARAAGCTVNGQWRDIINNMSANIEEQLKAGIHV